MQDLIQGEAELDDEENDESFDEETGEAAPRKERQNGHMDDSSEEEDDDDDEEAAREVRPRPPSLLCCAPHSPVARSVKDSSSTMRKMSPRTGRGAVARTRSEGALSGRKRKPF